MPDAAPHAPDVNRNALWARIIIDELVAAGVQHVCISPGSRSTPLTLAAASHPSLAIHSHIDERSAAFFALGCAKITGTPAALICTSGSAAAHYLPAFIEARYARIPLIALTADRPVELIDTGAPQTIDQQRLFGSHALDAVHLENPDVSPQALRRLRTTLQRLASRARGRIGSAAPAGPVHINVPMREPLEPTPTPGDPPPELYVSHPLEMMGRADGAPWIHHDLSPLPVDQETAKTLATTIAHAERGVLVCGPHEPSHGAQLPAALRRLARAAHLVTLPDIISSARLIEEDDPRWITTYDAILRAPLWRATHRPDVIVRFGAQPTSKAYRLWRELHSDTLEIVIDPFGQLLDQPQLASQLICADPTALAELTAAHLEQHHTSTPPPQAAWLKAWAAAHTTAGDALREAVDDLDAPLWEGRIARDVARNLSPRAILALASSMPIRDADAFVIDPAHGPLMIANRGANGIDGLIACAAGVAAAAAPEHPVTLLIGDVAFLHDASSLLAATRGPDPAKPPLRLDIVVINNDGGSIFAYLPIAQHPEHFERHFITPHHVHISALCLAYGVPHQPVHTAAELERALKMPHTPGVRVIEAFVDRHDNVARHKRLWSHIADTLDIPIKEQDP